MTNIVDYTLGYLLQMKDATIARNAMSILKRLQAKDTEKSPCAHMLSTAVYEERKLQGYRCHYCGKIKPVLKAYQNRKK